MGAISKDEAFKYIGNLQARSLLVALYLNESTEVSGVGYTRQPVTLNNGVVVAFGVRTSNVGDVSFGPAGSDWASPPLKITWVKVIDSADNKIVWAGSLPDTSQLSVLTNHPYEIKAGALGLVLETYD